MTCDELKKAPVWLNIRYTISYDELKKFPVWSDIDVRYIINWLDMHQDTDCGEL